MTRSLLTLAVLSALAVPAAAEHLVSPQAAQAQLLARESARASDLAAVDAFIASADGQRALGTLGVEAGAVRAALPTLSDSDLAELAARTAALQTDPVAGALSREVIWISAIALAAIILIILIA